MKQFTSYFFVAAAFLYLTSCSGGRDSGKAHSGSIILGDSSTIVTEADSSYLNDQVTDIEPQQLLQPSSPAQDSLVPKTASVTKERESVTPTSPVPAQRDNGFLIDFGQGVQVSFLGIKTRSFQQQNPEKDAGVSYAVTSGDLSKSSLNISGLKNVKVRQRYQSSLLLKSEGEVLSLENLGNYLSDWQGLSGNGKIYNLKSLQNVRFKPVGHNTIQNGVRHSARSSRLSRQKTNFWLDAIRKTRSANDEPCQIKLDNVQWQISGETASGRNFHKTIRLEP